MPEQQTIICLGSDMPLDPQSGELMRSCRPLAPTLIGTCQRKRIFCPRGCGQLHSHTFGAHALRNDSSAGKQDLSFYLFVRALADWPTDLPVLVQLCFLLQAAVVRTYLRE